MNKFNFISSFGIGDSIKYIGCSKEQISWGNNDTPHMLNVGEIYIVDAVEIHSQHTKISLKGVVGKFNSVCFATP